jgi:hypothetical protein
MNSVSVLLRGGLGNILFQVSTAYAVSKRDNMDFCVDLSKYHGGRYDVNKYFPNILRKIKVCNFFNHDFFFGESQHTYSGIPKFSSDTKLNGYFQSEKYFKEYRKEILELLSPNSEIINKLENRFGEILKKDTCSIHIRRGDYIHLSEYYFNLPLNYYEKSVNIIGSNKTFLVFSDDIEWCKSNLDFIENKIFIDDLEDYESLYLMSLCKNNITSNSTFGWWGAWMNENEDKIVVCSNEWFGKSLKHLLNSSDINCENWIKL